jgi:dynein heavy chain
MVRPPPGVRLVMEAVCIIKGIKPKEIKEPGKKMVEDYWDAARVMMGETGFLRSLIEFDRDNIPEPTIVKLQPYIRSEDFSPAAVSKVSRACTSLCMWVRALESYHQVLKVVIPKK